MWEGDAASRRVCARVWPAGRVPNGVSARVVCAPVQGAVAALGRHVHGGGSDFARLPGSGQMTLTLARPTAAPAPRSGAGPSVAPRALSVVLAFLSR